MKNKTLLYISASVITMCAASSANATFENCEKHYKQGSDQSFEACIDAANDENPDAQKFLGDLFYWGWGRGGNNVKDIDQAFYWYRKAGANGQVEAQYNLGVMYEQGSGIELDYSRAISWYNIASKNGHTDAMFNLANMYSKGMGTKANQSLASRWYLQAAKQGEVNAQYNIANRLAQGNGASVDVIEAYKWYLIAQKAGVPEAKPALELLKSEMSESAIKKAEWLAESWKPETSQN